MKLTTKGRYAVTAILDLVMYGGESPVNLHDISTRQKISLSYLEQLFTRLRRQGIVESIRGPGGGYRLVRNPCDINVAEVIDAVGERVETSRCSGEANCCDHEPCLTHHLWQDLDHHIRSYLESISFTQLADDRVSFMDKFEMAQSASALKQAGAQN